jgi:hypothetical protein
LQTVRPRNEVSTLADGKNQHPRSRPAGRRNARLEIAIELVPSAEAYPPGIDDMRRRKPVIEKLAGVTGFWPATRLREIIRLARSRAPKSRKGILADAFSR